MPFTVPENLSDLNRIQQNITEVGFFTVNASLDDLLNDSTADEVSGGGYQRQTATFAVQTVNNVSFVENSNAIQFPTATGTWGEIGYVGIFDANGSLWFFANMQSQSVFPGADVSIAAGAIRIS